MGGSSERCCAGGGKSRLLGLSEACGGGRSPCAAVVCAWAAVEVDARAFCGESVPRWEGEPRRDIKIPLGMAPIRHGGGTAGLMQHRGHDNDFCGKHDGSSFGRGAHTSTSLNLAPCAKLLITPAVNPRTRQSN